jgi:hypothetical protein
VVVNLSSVTFLDAGWAQTSIMKTVTTVTTIATVRICLNIVNAPFLYKNGYNDYETITPIKKIVEVKKNLCHRF